LIKKKFFFILALILCLGIYIPSFAQEKQEITGVTVRGVIRNLHADTSKRVVIFSVSIIDEKGNQIGARGFEVPFGKTKVETLQNCRKAIIKALKPIGNKILKWKNRPIPKEAHLDFNNRALIFSYPDEKLTLGDEVPLPIKNGDYGP